MICQEMERNDISVSYPTCIDVFTLHPNLFSGFKYAVTMVVSVYYITLVKDQEWLSLLT